MAGISKATLDRARRAERDQLADTGAISRHTVDAYQNFQQSIGLGTDNALSNSTYGFNPITRVRTLLEWIYRGSWFGRMAIDIRADDMTRGGIDLLSTLSPEDSEKIQLALVRLGIWRQVNDLIKWARLYGGAIGVLMIEGQNPATPLNIDRIDKGAFKGILVLDRWMVEPQLNDLVTEEGPEIGLPKYYKVVADAPAYRMRAIHHSRCIRLEGIRLPYWQRVMENLWGLSVFEPLYDRMVSFDSATMGMAQLVYKAYLRTYKVKGFRKILAEGGDAEQALIRWVQMMRRLQGNEGISVIDADDDMTSASQTTFSGIDDCVLSLAQQLGGAIKTPLTRLLGQSPAGLNSTGESDLRTYHEGINQDQEADLRMPVDKVIRVTAASERVKLPDNFTFAFRPLLQMSEVQRSEVFARDSQALADLESGGQIRLDTFLKELRQLSKTTGRGTNITDEEIEDAESAPPRPRETEPAGAEGGELEAGSEIEGGEKPKPKLTRVA